MPIETLGFFYVNLEWNTVLDSQSDPGVNQQVKEGGLPGSLPLGPPDSSPSLSHCEGKRQVFVERDVVYRLLARYPRKAPQAGGQKAGIRDTLLIDSLSFHWGSFVATKIPSMKESLYAVWRPTYPLLEVHDKRVWGLMLQLL